MSIIYGGVEYKTGDYTSYLYDQRKIRIGYTDPQLIPFLFREEYHFICPGGHYSLPSSVEFCSCFLFENLMKKIVENLSPSLGRVLEHSQYRPDKWYSDLVKLEKQMDEWPFYRAKHMDENKGDLYTNYWKLIDVTPPVFRIVRIPDFLRLSADKQTSAEYKKWMETLYNIELEMKDNVLEVENKLYELIKKI